MRRTGYPPRKQGGAEYRGLSRAPGMASSPGLPGQTQCGCVHLYGVTKASGKPRHKLIKWVTKWERRLDTDDSWEHTGPRVRVVPRVRGRTQSSRRPGLGAGTLREDNDMITRGTELGSAGETVQMRTSGTGRSEVCVATAHRPISLCLADLCLCHELPP